MCTLRTRILVVALLGLSLLLFLFSFTQNGLSGQILFVSFGSDNDTTVTNHSDIFVMDSNGENVEQITDDNLIQARAHWSPGRDRVVFSASSIQSDNEKEIYVITTEGNSQQRLTNNNVSDTDPAFSPNTTQIAFISQGSAGSGSNLYLMTDDWTSIIQLTPRQADDSFLEFWPTWSPDGTRIAFGSGRTNNAGPTGLEAGVALYVIGTDGNNMEVLAPTVGYLSLAPDWSSRGDRIVFVMGNEGEPDSFNIYTINANGTRLQEIDVKDQVDGIPAYPVWSPNDNHIAFAAVTTTDPSGGGQATGSIIYIIDADGSNLRQIIEIDGRMLIPTDWR